ncbi:MAG: galactokinase [Candidatus Latescibacteria bacterium]|nr:galactokinase [Candidatus Latescibacterota bacterium]
MTGNDIESTVAAAFERRFGKKHAVLVAAPGRVNLIGEHTDYNGFPVLPISIPFTINVAASPRTDSNVSISNVDGAYEDDHFTLSADIPHSSPGDWSNYVKAAANELAARIGRPLNGMEAVFGGSIPNSAGLSSSSALVVASALAVLATNGVTFDPVELAEMMAYGEHYVGTQGGGMDQAICLLGKAGHAVKLEFFPLRHTYVSFPEGFSIVAAHSLVRAAKTEDALLLYNRRPAECRLATALINARYAPKHPLNRLGDLPGKGFFETFGDEAAFVDEVFPKESYSIDDVAGFLGIPAVTVTERYLMTRSGLPMPVPPDGFLIRQRVMHVLTEAARVERSRDVLEAGDAEAFGKLMNESHESCDKLYGISTPELNALASIMRESGALGARLTGAGFGGCAIGLVPDSGISAVTEAVRSRYYCGYLAENRPELVEGIKIDDGILFALKPAEGARVASLI